MSLHTWVSHRASNARARCACTSTSRRLLVARPPPESTRAPTRCRASLRAGAATKAFSSKRWKRIMHHQDRGARPRGPPLASEGFPLVRDRNRTACCFLPIGGLEGAFCTASSSFSAGASSRSASLGSAASLAGNRLIRPSLYGVARHAAAPGRTRAGAPTSSERSVDSCTVSRSPTGHGCRYCSPDKPRAGAEPKIMRADLAHRSHRAPIPYANASP